jgi:predicted ATPase/DNA-binding SARP family transcriptional activator
MTQVLKLKSTSWLLPPPESQPVLRVSLLGPFRVRIDDRAVPDDLWRRRKARAVVKLLALSPNYSLHREQVLDTLWPQMSPAAAANNLYVALYQARRALGSGNGPPSFLHLEADQLVLAGDHGIWVDADAFEAAYALARRSGDRAHYEAALELYRGELLPEDRYEEWTERRRAALHDAYLHLLLDLAQLHEEQHALSAARATWERVLRAEPACETAHLGLMRCFARLGQRQFAMRQFDQLRAELRRELDAEPDATSKQLYNDIVAGRFPVSPLPMLAPAEEAPVTQHNLPTQLTSFVGRECELVEVQRLLASTRLLTILGAGGSGKTRLALQLGQLLLDRYPDGVWFIDLTPLTNERLLPLAVARMLKVRETNDQDIGGLLIDALRQKRMLLIFDNCEHLVYACAQLVVRLLSNCLGLHVIATSREALLLRGEQIWRIPPLLLPEPGRAQQRQASSALAEYAAVRLFIARARAHLPQFNPDDDTLHAIVTLCQRLDGLPLAIELAAARISTLAPKQILARLDQALQLLSAGSRTAAPRHQTMRATIDWSYALLRSAEQTLLNTLAVFAGGWTLEAAESVAAGDVEVTEVFLCLARLVDKSLVVVGGDREQRYRLPETIRAYAQAMLAASGRRWQAQQRHAMYYLALTEAAEPELAGPDQVVWLARLERETDNIRAALDWTVRQRQFDLTARIATALRSFWQIRGSWSEGRRWLALALTDAQLAPELRVRTLNTAGRLARQQGDLDQAMVMLQESLQLDAQLGSRQGRAVTLGCMGVIAYDQRDFERARALHTESLLIRFAIDDGWGIGATLTNLGEVARQQQQYALAVQLHQESVAVFRELGDRWGVALVLTNLGVATQLLGDLATAKAALAEGLLLYRELGDKEGIAATLEGIAVVAAAQGNAAQSARCGGAAAALRRAISAPLSPADTVQYEQHLASARAQLGNEAFNLLWDETDILSLDDALSYAATEAMRDL